MPSLMLFNFQTFKDIGKQLLNHLFRQKVDMMDGVKLVSRLNCFPKQIV
jgi:hypothetical protein